MESFFASIDSRLLFYEARFEFEGFGRIVEAHDLEAESNRSNQSEQFDT
jgi:hypothetical protein